MNQNKIITISLKRFTCLVLFGLIPTNKAQGAELDEPSYPYPVNYVELQGGEDELSGNVFAVNSDGFFGPVCDDGWDNLAAMVVCRQLGFVWGIPTVSSHFGEVRPPVFSIDEIDCVGDEKHLQDCPHVNHDDCDSGDAAGVFCSNISYPSNYIELRGGEEGKSGNVFAISEQGFLGPVCDDSWDFYDAGVVCRQLGYDWGEPVGNAFFGEVGWDASYSMARVNCVGNESHIQDCPYYPETCCGTTDCYLPWEVAGVTCHRGSHLKGQVELRGGNSSNMGNVWAVNGDGYLGPVCENSCWNCSGINDWDNHEASVVCRQLGFSWGQPTQWSYFGDVPHNSFSMVALGCNGTEAGLQDCSYTMEKEDLNWCFEDYAVGVVCHDEPQPTALELRGGDERSGNVYAANNDGVFGPVCDSRDSLVAPGVPGVWGKEEAEVVCRQLGFDGGDPTIGSQFGEVEFPEGDFSMAEMECYGNEGLIQDCSYTVDLYNAGCWPYPDVVSDPNMGAGVICFYDSD